MTTLVSQIYDNFVTADEEKALIVERIPLKERSIVVKYSTTWLTMSITLSCVDPGWRKHPEKLFSPI